LVSYVDYDAAKPPADSDGLYRVMWKRRAFRHEEEVRFVTVVEPDCENEMGRQTGIDIAVELEQLVQGICIDPYAPEWFEKVVRAVVSKFAPGLSDRVTWSSIKAEPLY
jgi:hypothetical protein